ncbi:hypothetical protein [Streptomyces lydicus]|uniref:hypothetical protein n=1 Tax=Streptomyces lydicus TaxID=47763 RepID=UPI0037A4FFE9
MTTLERPTLTPAEIAEQVATFGIPADEIHQAEQAHWIDPLDQSLADATNRYLAEHPEVHVSTEADYPDWKPGQR